MRAVPLAVAAGVSAALIALYLALGGATYKPLAVADPCQQRSTEELVEREDVLEQLVLSALDGAACRLQVTREELTLALATAEARAEFGRAHHVDDQQIDDAVRAGLERAVEDAERIGAISSFEAGLFREVVERLPLSIVIDALQTGAGTSLLGLLTDLLAQGAEPGG